MPQLLTTKQAASCLALAPETLDTWRSRGGGPEFVKLGGAVRYSQESIEKFLRERTVRSTAQLQQAA